MAFTVEGRAVAAAVRNGYADRIDTAPWEPWMVDPARACAGAPTEEFFRYGNAAGYAIQDYCAHCPVIRQCQEWALRIPSLCGVWGGMTASDRNRLRGERALRAASGG